MKKGHHDLYFTACMRKMLSFILPVLVVQTKSGMVTAAVDDEWQISPPVYAFTESAIEMAYTVNGQIESRMVDLKLYDTADCLAGTRAIPPSAADMTVNNFMAYDRTTSLDSTSNERSVDLTLTIDYLKIASAPKLQKNVPAQNEARLMFCVRAAVFSARLSDPKAVLKSWREDIVTLTFDASSQYDITEVGVELREEGGAIDLKTDTFEVDVFQCNFRNRPIDDKPKREGSDVRICLDPHVSDAAENDDVEQTTTVDISVESIDAFLFSHLTTVQSAITDGKVSPNGLTTMNCGAEAEMCSFETELVEAFFDRDGAIQGHGIVTLRYEETIVQGVQVQVYIPIGDSDDTPEPETTDDDTPWYKFLEVLAIFIIVALIGVAIFLVVQVIRALRGVKEAEVEEEHVTLAAAHAEQLAKTEYVNDSEEVGII